MALLRRAPRTHWKRLLLGLSLALSVALLAAACGGGGEEEGKTPAAKESPTAEGSPTGQRTPAAGQTATSGGDTGKELKELSADWGNITAKVTYDFTSTAGGQTTETRMTFYSRPPDSRLEYKDGSQETIFLSTGGKSYICTAQGGQGTCLASPTGDSVPLPFFGDFADPDAIDEAVGDVLGVDIYRFQEEIAGEDAECFSASGSFTVAQGKATWCFADDGLLLRSAFGGGTSGEFSMEATEVSRKVSDSDFEPPYPVTELPR